MPQSATQPTGEDIQRAAEEIVNQPVFLRSDQAKALEEAMIDRAADWFRELGQWAESSPDSARLLTYGLIAVLLALIVHMAYVFIAEIARNTADGGKSPKGRGASVVALEGQAADWSDALAQARAALKDGDRRRAVWIAHRLLLSALDQGGRLAFAKWKTNRHFLAECGGEDEDAALLRRLTGIYNRLVYAHEDAASEETLRTMLDEVARRGATA